MLKKLTFCEFIMDIFVNNNNSNIEKISNCKYFQNKLTLNIVSFIIITIKKDKKFISMFLFILTNICRIG